MKLTTRGEYALRALQVLATHYGGEVVAVEAVAREQNLPKRYLEQILGDLRTAGLVESRRGKAGGYRLARPPAEIPLATVIRQVDGALAPVGCVSTRFYEKCSCPDESRCAVRAVMKEARDAVAAVMERMTLADLAAEAARLQKHPLAAVDFQI